MDTVDPNNPEDMIWYEDHLSSTARDWRREWLGEHLTEDYWNYCLKYRIWRPESSWHPDSPWSKCLLV